MQILHIGQIVRARRRRWRVVDVRLYDGCRCVSLAGIGADAGEACELLAPFDLVEPQPAPSLQPRRVGRARWRHAARALVARCGAPGLLHATPAADIDVLPYQLEPAIAMLRGDGCRVLLADEVGLGKTIQAGAIVAELRARGLADRVLVLTPPGIRDQWRDELSRRFHLAPDIADARSVRRRIAELPPEVNPWTTWRTAIASIDYVKRPEVLRAVLACRWDVVIVDEAHRVANDGERRQAASALASRAGYVVLLTATPHSGDAAAFEALCMLGALGDRLLVFRRTRRALASAVDRHIHRLHVRSTADELRMHARLDAFARAVRAERGDGNPDMWIALALLRKRAFSSAHALHLSVTRRLDALDGITSPATQLLLPLDEDGETIAADEAPAWQAVLGLRDVEDERRLLAALADAAGAAARHESKVAAIRRFLKRLREPLIIFTEYRDTLTHVAREIGERSVVLHGGLSRADRTAALESFAQGKARILLATDAAAEGLNLHRTCRSVINLELPWNPMRLEQRIGRVDRIGQIRTVHAFHLIGRDSGEQGLLDELRLRIAQAQGDIGAPDPLDGAFTAGDVAPLHSDHVDATADALRLGLARALGSPAADDDRPLVAVARNRHTRARLRSQTLLLWECAVTDGGERVVASRLVPLSAGGTDSALPALIERSRHVVETSASTWPVSVVESARAFASAAMNRAAAIETAVGHDGPGLMQPGLFDRRAHFAQAALAAAHDEALAALADRKAELALRAELTPLPPRLRLALVP